MATLSSHLLNSVDGTHASGVEIIIYQINSSGDKKFSSKLRQMKEEEF
jgi:5-hydroxyisourate hydrolase